MERCETAAFVLHSSPMGEQGLFLDLISPEYGRFTVLSRNGRSRRSQIKAMVQLFSPLRLTFRDDGETRVLCGCAAAGMPFSFHPPFLFVALYVNELTALLFREKGEGSLFFASYLRTLSAIAELERKYGDDDNPESSSELEVILRCFELDVISSCGIGLDWRYDANSGALIEAQNRYVLEPDNGFREHTVCDNNDSLPVFLGADIQAIASRHMNVNILRTAKKICRLVLAHLLQGRSLNSKRLYQDYLQTVHKQS